MLTFDETLIVTWLLTKTLMLSSELAKLHIEKTGRHLRQLEAYTTPHGQGFNPGDLMWNFCGQWRRMLCDLLQFSSLTRQPTLLHSQRFPSLYCATALRMQCIITFAIVITRFTVARHFDGQRVKLFVSLSITLEVKILFIIQVLYPHIFVYLSSLKRH